MLQGKLLQKRYLQLKIHQKPPELNIEEEKNRTLVSRSFLHCNTRHHSLPTGIKVFGRNGEHIVGRGEDNFLQKSNPKVETKSKIQKPGSSVPLTNSSYVFSLEMEQSSGPEKQNWKRGNY